jgi:hypothetical protein
MLKNMTVLKSAFRDSFQNAKFGLNLEEVAAIGPVRAAFETSEVADRNFEQNSPAAVIR